MCGGELYHEPGCELAREEYIIEALQALRWAYIGAPLYPLCSCELGYPGVLGCPHGSHGSADPLKKKQPPALGNPRRGHSGLIGENVKRAL